MKIAYITDFLPGSHSRAGGADWVALRAGELLGKNNIQVEYFTLHPDIKNQKKDIPINFVPVIELFLPKPLAITTNS